jgi:hypothetical protein
LTISRDIKWIFFQGNDDPREGIMPGISCLPSIFRTGGKIREDFSTGQGQDR